MGRRQPEVFQFAYFSAINAFSGRGPGRIFAPAGRRLSDAKARLASRLPQGRPLLNGCGPNAALLQEPGFRMARHSILTPRPYGPEDVEFAAMPADKPGFRQEARGTGISLFRSGQHTALPPVTLDLATGREIFSAPLPPSFANPAKVWESLRPVTLSPATLTQNGLFLEASDHPAATAFDILRTRLLHGLAEKGWKRIAVTSPTHGCGKSFVAINLAFALARRPASRTVLMDFDLRHPEIAQILGVKDEISLGGFLAGHQALESEFRRFDRTLALGLNSVPIERASETLHDPDTVTALAAMLEQLDPEVVIYDLPPALVNDDLLALGPSLDAVLLVTDGTKSTPQEIRACEKLFEGRLPLLGVVLNRAQDFNAGRYRYAKT